MITGELKSKVDRIWDTMWSGSISNPLSVIEQLTYLLFINRLDERQTLKQSKAARTGKPIEDPIFKKGQDALRWSRFKETAPEEMFKTVQQELPPATLTPPAPSGYVSDLLADPANTNRLWCTYSSVSGAAAVRNDVTVDTDRRKRHDVLRTRGSVVGSCGVKAFKPATN
jgi:hypothetical protein